MYRQHVVTGRGVCVGVADRFSVISCQRGIEVKKAPKPGRDRRVGEGEYGRQAPHHDTETRTVVLSAYALHVVVSPAGDQSEARSCRQVSPVVIGLCRLWKELDFVV